MKPVVLLCFARQVIGMNFSPNLRVHCASSQIIEILCKLGCTPIGIPVGVDPQKIKAAVAIADGVLLGPGQDLCPELYGETLKVEYSANVSGIGTAYRRPLALRPDPERDELELTLYRHARLFELPVLGICRGMQLINVAEGGSLHQELDDSLLEHQIGIDGWVHHHSLDIVEGSLLQRLVRGTSLTISTVHHQGVKQLASSLVPTAHTSDGLIEALELRKPSHFLLGLQGHIEQSVMNLPELKCIWNAFIGAAAKRKRTHAY